MSRIRFDHLLTTGVVYPALRVARRLRSRDGARDLPILMYHSISDDPEPGVSPYYRTVTSPRRFAEHMSYFRDNGWRAVTLREGLRSWKEAPASERLVAVTFDDGFRDFYTHAFPVLRQCGFAATMYLPTAFIGHERRGFKKRECLTWNEVKLLAEAGIEFGSHSVNHPKLVDLPWPEIESELSDSKSSIEQELGSPVTAFAYPFAFPQADVGFGTRFRELVTKAGYQSCVTTEIGRAFPGDDPLRLKRLPVNDADDPGLFAAKLNGGYDWLAKPQRLAKRFKRFLQR